MSCHTWPGTKAAYRALRRIADGKPAFPGVGTHPNVIRARRKALRYLFAEGYIRRGPKPGGPEVTERGRLEFVRTARFGQKPSFSADQLETIRKHYAELGPSTLAERLGGAKVDTVYRAAKRLGVRRNRVLTRKSDRLQEMPYP